MSRQSQARVRTAEVERDRARVERDTYRAENSKLLKAIDDKRVAEFLKALAWLMELEDGNRSMDLESLSIKHNRLHYYPTATHQRMASGASRKLNYHLRALGRATDDIHSFIDNFDAGLPKPPPRPRCWRRRCPMYAKSLPRGAEFCHKCGEEASSAA